jgi:hypothetical protein
MQLRDFFLFLNGHALLGWDFLLLPVGLHLTRRAKTNLASAEKLARRLIK